MTKTYNLDKNQLYRMTKDIEAPKFRNKLSKKLVRFNQF